LEEIEDRIAALEDREAVWSPEVMAIAGAIVTIGYDGKAETHLGYVRPGDKPNKSAKAKLSDAPDGGSADGETSGCALSAPLIESLTVHRTAALAAALKDRPDIALAAVVYTIAQKVHYAEFGATALMLSASTSQHRLAQDSVACAAMESARQQWGRLTSKPLLNSKWAEEHSARATGAPSFPG